MIPARQLIHSLGFLVIAACLCAVSLSAETIRVASFNLYNYLDTNRWIEGHYRMDYPKPEVEKDAVRKIIIAANPDVLAVQEIGGPLHLEELRRDLARDGLNYKYSDCLVAFDDNRRIGVLSKMPFQAKEHTDLDYKYFDGREPIRRGLQEITFGEGQSSWTLFNVHLKSRWTDRDDDPESEKHRTGEAQAARNYIKQNFPAESARYLIVGDFNDVKRSAPLRRFLESGDTELSKIVPCADSRGERWTFHYRKEDRYERVDFILASPSLFPAIQGDGTIFDQQPESSQASDHRLLYVDLQLDD